MDQTHLPQNKRYNLAFFVAAIDRPLLWYTLKQIKSNLHLFNGRKLITIALLGDDATTKEMCELSRQEYHTSVVNRGELTQHIKDYLNDPTIEYTVTLNHPLCETTAFIDGMGPQLASSNPEEATLYCHTKGIRYPGNDVRMQLWAGTIYSHIFDFSDVEYRLWDGGFTSYGVFKRDGQVYSWTGNDIRWHYSGGIYWFKHVPFFGYNWKCQDKNRGVMEYIIPRVTSTQQAYCPLDMPREFAEGGEFYKLTKWQEYLTNRGTTVQDELNRLGWTCNR